MFDPYHTWLGIPPKDQPADHYRVLGLERFEPHPDVISNAVDRQMAHVRSVGQHHEQEQAAVLCRLAAARVCLLDPGKRRQYDRMLLESSRIERANAIDARPPMPGPTKLDRAQVPWVNSTPCRVGAVAALVAGITIWLLLRAMPPSIAPALEQTQEAEADNRHHGYQLPALYPPPAPEWTITEAGADGPSEAAELALWKAEREAEEREWLRNYRNAETQHRPQLPAPTPVPLHLQKGSRSSPPIWFDSYGKEMEDVLEAYEQEAQKARRDFNAEMRRLNVGADYEITEQQMNKVINDVKDEVRRLKHTTTP